MGSTLRVLLAAALLLQASNSMAADGDLDPSFGTLGKVTTTLATFSSAADVAIQVDGKIVIVGTLSSGNVGEPSTMVVARYDAAGVLDPSFNGVGYVIAENPMFGVSGVAVALQSDGRIVALAQSGQVTHGASEMFVLRYESDGDPDLTFGGDGMVEPISLVAGAGDLALTEDGEILVAFTGADASFNVYTRVLRLLESGTLDSSFGVGGVAELPGFPLGGSASMGFRTDGKIIVGTSNVMQITPAFVSAFAAGRLSASGGVDTTFGSGGMSPVFGDTVYAPGAAADVALQVDGRPVVAGAAGGSFALVGMGVDGGLDTTFGTGGTFSDAFATQATAVRAYGATFIAGGGGPQFALARVNTAGVLDPSFGTAGKVTTSFGDSFSIANAVVVQEDGAIVAVGSTGSESASSLALARYLGTAVACPSGDADNDGLCDADDQCIGDAILSRAVLTLSDFQQPGCEARLVLKGMLDVPGGASIDPGANGLRVVVRDGAGTIILDDTLPPGAYDQGTQTGWLTRMGAGGATWRFLRPAAALTRALVRQAASTPDTVKLVLKSRALCLAAPPVGLALTATVVFTPPQACGDARFPGAPDPSCSASYSGNRIACK